MSKTITIPSGLGSRITVIINGVKYVYKPGETVIVPDDVAALFENNAGEAVVYGRKAEDHLFAQELYQGSDFIPVVVDEQGQMKVRKSDVENSVDHELPDVSASDNGKVLAVVEGAWAKAAPSGGTFIVTVEDGETENTYVSDKTFAEISAAISDGQSVVCRYYPSGGATAFFAHLTAADGNYVSFTGPVNWSSNDRILEYLYVEIGVDDAVTADWVDVSVPPPIT